jgi:hypothetical protein
MTTPKAAPTTQGEPDTDEDPPPKKKKKAMAAAFHPVLELPGGAEDLAVLPFPGGATIIDRSLLLVVRGDSVEQNPAWLAGLPQAVNGEGIRVHATRLAQAPEAGQPFPADFRVGTVKMGGPKPTGPFEWRGEKGFAAISASAKTKAIAGVPAALDGTGERAFPTADGGMIVVRTGGSQLTLYRVDGNQKLKSTETFPLPAGVNELSVVRYAEDEILVAGDAGGLFSLKDGSIGPLTGPEALPIARAAAFEDGTVWAITAPLKTAPAALFSRSKAGDWTRQSLPEGHRPTQVWANGSRVWLATDAGGKTSLWSNEAVKTPLTVEAANVPWADGTEPLPVTSDAPTAPATAACSNVVVWLGPALDKGIVEAVAADEKAKSLPFLLASGRPKLVAAGVKGATIKQATGALLLNAESYDTATAARTSLAPTLAKLGGKVKAPRLLCAVVKQSRKLGPK